MPQEQHLSIPIMEAWSVFRLHCKSQRYRVKSIEDYEWKLLPFLKWAIADGAANLEDITPQHLRRYIVEKQTIYRGTKREREASGHTSHGIARCLRSFFNFCVTEEWIARSPMATIKMPRRPKKILDAYTDAEIKKVFKAAGNERDQALLYVLLDTGIRARECIALCAGDVSIENNSILIREGKGGKERIVYFGAKTARYLIRHMRGMKPKHMLWRNLLRDEPLTYFGLAQLLRRIGKAAGVQCNAHKFRRTFAISSLRNGMNVYLLAKLMGHEDISILKPYLQLLESDMKAGHEKYGVVDNL